MMTLDVYLLVQVVIEIQIMRRMKMGVGFFRDENRG